MCFRPHQHWFRLINNIKQWSDSVFFCGDYFKSSLKKLTLWNTCCNEWPHSFKKTFGELTEFKGNCFCLHEITIWLLFISSDGCPKSLLQQQYSFLNEIVLTTSHVLHNSSVSVCMCLIIKYTKKNLIIIKMGATFALLKKKKTLLILII